MDITNFINSRDIRDYHRQIGYKYNALEAAWLVYQCRDISVKKKHDAWKWIINNMPDCKVSNGRIHSDYYGQSVHKTVADYMEMEQDFIDSFMTESGWLYTYSHSFKCGGEREVDIVYDKAVFSSVEKCIEQILKSEDPEETTFAEIARKRPDEDIYYNRHGSIVIDLSGKIVDVSIEDKDDLDRSVIDLIYFFEDLWFEFPVPFKCGDIVFLRNRLGKEVLHGFLWDGSRTEGIER